MSQHKAAMERLHAGSGEGPDATRAEDGRSSGGEGPGGAVARPPPAPAAPPHPILAFVEAHAAFLLMPVLPLLWCLLVVCTLDREQVRASYGMPLLGVGSATLANAVPVGGGIVFVPILEFFGVHMQLGTAFAVATMTFGNGVFGFLNWSLKDPRAIAWHIVPWAVLPAWLGAAIGTLHPLISPARCRSLFGAFALAVAALVGRGLHVGRQDARPGQPFAIARRAAATDDGAAPAPRGAGETRLVAGVASFLAGLVLVAHIGIGNAVVTFVVASFAWRLPAKDSVVTAIVVGGWTSLCPFLLHLLVLRDVPVALWVMCLPGVYAGAHVAPLAHRWLGIANVLAVFVLFLLLIAALMLS